MLLEKSAYWGFILIVLLFAYFSLNTVFDGVLLSIEQMIEMDETGIGKELLGGFAEGLDKVFFEILPRD